MEGGLLGKASLAGKGLFPLPPNQGRRKTRETITRCGKRPSPTFLRYSPDIEAVNGEASIRSGAVQPGVELVRCLGSIAYPPYSRAPHLLIAAQSCWAERKIHHSQRLRLTHRRQPRSGWRGHHTPPSEPARTNRTLLTPKVG